MLTRRIIPCLDVKDGVVVKGVKFRDHVVLGGILELARRYRDQGADELVFYDITASSEDRSVSVEWVRKTAKALDIPFCVAGGIRSVAMARRVLNAGADKISINSPALERPDLIGELAEAFGNQCVVVGIDSMRQEDELVCWQYTGKESTAHASQRRTKEWVHEIQERGAGEVVLNCMDADGTRHGYDVEQLAEVRAACRVPLIASGGAGSVDDFVAVFNDADVDGALAAGIFHREEILVSELKRQLSQRNILVRPC